MLRKQVVLIKKGDVIHILRYGLVVRISGSHPGGPGSIPGNGILFSVFPNNLEQREINKKYSHAGS